MFGTHSVEEESVEIAAANLFRAQSLLKQEGYTYSQEKLSKLGDERASYLVQTLESNQGNPEGAESSLSAYVAEINLNHPNWTETNQDSGGEGNEFGVSE